MSITIEETRCTREEEARAAASNPEDDDVIYAGVYRIDDTECFTYVTDDEGE